MSAGILLSTYDPSIDWVGRFKRDGKLLSGNEPTKFNRLNDKLVIVEKWLPIEQMTNKDAFLLFMAMAHFVAFGSAPSQEV